MNTTSFLLSSLVRRAARPASLPGRRPPRSLTSQIGYADPAGTPSPIRQEPRRRFGGNPGRAAAAVVTVGALGSVLLLSGCGQNFEQEGGVVPVPRATLEGGPSATPAGNPDAVSVPADGYAPPRTAGPTQTAVPNLPGGKL